MLSAISGYPVSYFNRHFYYCLVGTTTQNFPWLGSGTQFGRVTPGPEFTAVQVGSVQVGSCEFTEVVGVQLCVVAGSVAVQLLFETIFPELS